MRIEDRLIEYGRSLLFPSVENCLPSENPLKRIKDYADGAGAGDYYYDMVTTTEADGEPPGVSVTTPCRPDGGVGALADKYKAVLNQGRRCNEMREALQIMFHLRKDHFEIVQKTYFGTHWRDVPRTQTDAARLLNVPLTTYRYRRDRMFEWLERQLCIYTRRAA